MLKSLLLALSFGLAAMLPNDASAQERTVTLAVSGMNCGMCPISVRHRAMQLPGVRKAKADMDSRTASVIYEDTEQNAQFIVESITKLGYPARILEVKP